uniref:PYM homolog 1, exon junction complex associated factor n=1 Tax=Rhinolophus ferrumequinum TaxID=59479 RepID=A0A671ECI6_RHIFE
MPSNICIFSSVKLISPIKVKSIQTQASTSPQHSDLTGPGASRGG